MRRVRAACIATRSSGIRKQGILSASGTVRICSQDPHWESTNDLADTSSHPWWSLLQSVWLLGYAVCNAALRGGLMLSHKPLVVTCRPRGPEEIVKTALPYLCGSSNDFTLRMWRSPIFLWNPEPKRLRLRLPLLYTFFLNYFCNWTCFEYSWLTNTKSSNAWLYFLILQFYNINSRVCMTLHHLIIVIIVVFFK